MVHIDSFSGVLGFRDRGVREEREREREREREEREGEREHLERGRKHIRQR